MAGQKTYWHLMEERRIPSDYEIVTSRLLYYPERGFEVRTPVTKWHDDHGKRDSGIDWERFRDPRETTYAKYTALQATQEAVVDSLLERAEKSGYPADLSPAWLDLLDDILAPALYPWHGLQMAACYVGQMAPSGKCTVAALFQAADEMRRIQRVAYLTRLIRGRRADFGSSAKERWLHAPEWQPLRQAIERLLVTYDWVEALVALNACLKPRLDELLLHGLEKRARAEGDTLVSHMLAGFLDDSQWHAAWSRVLLEIASPCLESSWHDRWNAAAHSAAAPLLARLSG